MRRRLFLTLSLGLPGCAFRGCERAPRAPPLTVDEIYRPARAPIRGFTRRGADLFGFEVVEAADEGRGAIHRLVRLPIAGGDVTELRRVEGPVGATIAVSRRRAWFVRRLKGLEWLMHAPLEGDAPETEVFRVPPGAEALAADDDGVYCVRGTSSPRAELVRVREAGAESVIAKEGVVERLTATDTGLFLDVRTGLHFVAKGGGEPVRIAEPKSHPLVEGERPLLVESTNAFELDVTTGTRGAALGAIKNYSGTPRASIFGGILFSSNSASGVFGSRSATPTTELTLWEPGPHAPQTVMEPRDGLFHFGTADGTSFILVTDIAVARLSRAANASGG